LANYLRLGEPVTVDFDGVEIAGPSFLEEAFGGLVRDEGLDIKKLQQLLTVRSDKDPSRATTVWRYINEASDERHHA